MNVFPSEFRVVCCVAALILFFCLCVSILADRQKRRARLIKNAMSDLERDLLLSRMTPENRFLAELDMIRRRPKSGLAASGETILAIADAFQRSGLSFERARLAMIRAQVWPTRSSEAEHYERFLMLHGGFREEQEVPEPEPEPKPEIRPIHDVRKLRIEEEGDLGGKSEGGKGGVS